MPQIKEAFFDPNVNTKSTLQYTLGVCSDVSFPGKVFSRNWHLLFVLILLISYLKVAFVLLSLLVSVHSDIKKIFYRFMSKNKSSYKYVLPSIKHIWRNNWITSGYETTVC
jgi:hypothetical protein